MRVLRVGGGAHTRAKWFATLYAALMRALETMPHPDTVRAARRGGMEDALREAALCRSDERRCATRAWKELPSFLDQLAGEVDRRISEVSPGVRPRSH